MRTACARILYGSVATPQNETFRAEKRWSAMNDARYIPPKRDDTPRRWRDRFVVRRIALAAVVMISVALVLFMLIYRRA
jgi:hypothetical protein